MAGRCFTVDGKLEIRDENGNIIHQEFIIRHDVWDDGGIYKTYLKCLKFAKNNLLAPAKEYGIRALVCRICSVCKHTEGE